MEFIPSFVSMLVYITIPVRTYVSPPLEVQQRSLADYRVTTLLRQIIPFKRPLTQFPINKQDYIIA